jgi:hypothetical protein
LLQEPLAGWSDGVLARVQKIEFDQVRLTSQEFFLLSQIEIPTWCPSGFVTGAEDFDNGHHAALVPYRQDLNENFAHLNWIECQYPGRVTNRSSRCAGSSLCRQREIRWMLDDDHIRVNAALGLNDIESFSNIGYVMRGQ